MTFLPLVLYIVGAGLLALTVIILLETRVVRPPIRRDLRAAERGRQTVLPPRRAARRRDGSQGGAAGQSMGA